MTHEEIQAAIERLRKISNGARGYNALEFVEAVIPDGPWIDGLTALLQQADPDTHVELPRDADGAPIHVGDVLYEEGDEPFEVYAFKVCEMMPSKTNGWELFGGVDGEGFSAYNPATCHHYRKPTIESVLHEFATKIFATKIFPTDDNDRFTMEKVAEYAAKLREVMTDDDEAR